jgi:hypothetical protein
LLCDERHKSTGTSFRRRSRRRSSQRAFDAELALASENTLLARFVLAITDRFVGFRRTRIRWRA